jgi:hypothetical protein
MTDTSIIREALDKLPGDEPLKSDALVALGRVETSIQVTPGYPKLIADGPNRVMFILKEGSTKYYSFLNGEFVLDKE